MKTEVSLISSNKPTRKDVEQKEEVEKQWGRRMMDGRIKLPAEGDFCDSGNQGTSRVRLRRVLFLSERGVYRENNGVFYFGLSSMLC